MTQTTIVTLPKVTPTAGEAKPRSPKRDPLEIALEYATSFLARCPAGQARAFGEQLVTRVTDPDQRRLFLEGVTKGQKP